MTPWLEIIIPVRNPGSRLLETGASLVQQMERGFGVVLSNNFSTTGDVVIEEFCRQMKAANIPVRRVKPLYELGRVPHWNWAHAQGAAEWLKPLFVGDLLLPGYVRQLRERIERQPHAHLVRCEFEIRASQNTSQTAAPFQKERLSPAEFLDYFPRLGNWLGGPINFAYSRTAWQAAGGFAPQLPACADLRLNVTIALRHGMEVIHESLAVFQLHEQRFSHGIRGRRVNGCFELWLILREARNYCQTVNLPWPDNGVLTGVYRQVRIDYWQAFKNRVKRVLS